MPQARTLRQLMEIRAFNRDKLESINNNLGTALGYKSDENGNMTEIPAGTSFCPN